MSLDINKLIFRSRTKLKQYVLANNKGLESGASFDNMFNKAIKSGVEKGEFAQPKGLSSLAQFTDRHAFQAQSYSFAGASGTVKLAKKETAAKPATTKKPAAAKKTKTDAPKKAKAPKKAATGEKKKTTTKKTTTKAAKPASKPKSTANTGAKRKSKAPAAVSLSSLETVFREPAPN